MDQFNGARIEPGAGHLRKIPPLLVAVSAKLNLWQIDTGLFCRKENRPGAFKLERERQFAGEHIDRAQRQNAQPGPLKSVRHIADPIKHLVDSAVAARSDHRFKPFMHGFCSQSPGITGGRC